MNCCKHRQFSVDDKFVDFSTTFKNEHELDDYLKKQEIILESGRSTVGADQVNMMLRMTVEDKDEQMFLSKQRTYSKLTQLQNGASQSPLLDSTLSKVY